MSTQSKPNSSKSGKKTRYAVVGLGHIAQVAVLPAFRSATNSELAAIVSGDSAKREKLARSTAWIEPIPTRNTMRCCLRSTPCNCAAQSPAPRICGASCAGRCPCALRKAHGGYGRRMSGNDRRHGTKRS